MFLYLPKYKEFTQAPRAEIFHKQKFDLLSMEWPLPCNETLEDAEQCLDDVPFSDFDFFDKLPGFISDCENDIGFDNTLSDFTVENVTLKQSKNGTLCQLQTNFFISNQVSPLNSSFCNLEIETSGLRECHSNSGNHAEAFWFYFLFRLIFDVTMNSAFAVMDGTALKQARENGQHYSIIMAFLQIGAALGSLMSGFLVDDDTEGKFAVAKIKK